MATNIPFLVDIFNAVSGKNGLVEIATRVKCGFVYSVLMNERWHELSLVKRVNTVLVIEGGCTKQV
jgi:cytochrome c oxidase subunit IV